MIVKFYLTARRCLAFDLETTIHKIVTITLCILIEDPCVVLFSVVLDTTVSDFCHWFLQSSRDFCPVPSVNICVPKGMNVSVPSLTYLRLVMR